MTVDQHHRASTRPDAHPLDTILAVRVRRFRYEPDPICGQRDRSEPLPEPVTTEVPDDPAAHAAAQRVLLLVLQVLNRRRPATHLAEVAAPAVARYVRAVTPVRGLVQVTSLHVSLPRPGAAEVVAVCQFDTRCHRAIAARLDRRRGTAWLCSALRLL